MSASFDVEDRKLQLAVFDSYSKTALKNLCRNILKARMRLKNREITGEKEMEYLYEYYGSEDKYPSEYAIFDGYRHDCIVTTEWLYQAMFRLPNRQKEVLILKFWYGMSVREMAKLLKVTEKTIYNREQAAFQFIREYHERNEK